MATPFRCPNGSARGQFLAGAGVFESFRSRPVSPVASGQVQATVREISGPGRRILRGHCQLIDPYRSFDGLC